MLYGSEATVPLPRHALKTTTPAANDATLAAVALAATTLAAARHSHIVRAATRIDRRRLYYRYRWFHRTNLRSECGRGRGHRRAQDRERKRPRVRHVKIRVGMQERRERRDVGAYQ